MKNIKFLAFCLFISLPLQAAEIISFSKNIESQKIVSQAFSPEGITLSDDGNSMAYLAKEVRDLSQVPPTTAWMVQKKNEEWSSPKKLPFKGMVTSVSFGNKDSWLVVSSSHGTASGYMNILKNLFGSFDEIGNLTGFKHRIEIYDAKKTKKLLMSLASHNFNLKKPEMLKHARVSPDGKWLTFYTHGYKEQKGIYVYNFATKKTVHLAAFDDKHPTWSTDSNKILFHHQTGGNSFTRTGASEKSFIGYYELNVNSENNLNPVRQLMNLGEDGVDYQKHPSLYAGTDLVFFHGEVKLNGPKKLLVRRLGAGSKIFKISDILFNDIELKGVKHANSSLSTQGLCFVSHPKGQSTSIVRQTRINVDLYAHLATNRVQIHHG